MLFYSLLAYILHHSNFSSGLMKSLFFSYWTKYFPNSLWFIIFPTANKNVLKFLRWGSDVLKFSLNWGSAMFLRCSYFFQNLSLDVLINKVLIQSNACMSCHPITSSCHVILSHYCLVIMAHHHISLSCYIIMPLHPFMSSCHITRSCHCVMSPCHITISHPHTSSCFIIFRRVLASL